MRCSLCGHEMFPLWPWDVPSVGMRCSLCGYEMFPLWVWAVPSVDMSCSLCGYEMFPLWVWAVHIISCSYRFKTSLWMANWKGLPPPAAARRQPPPIGNRSKKVDQVGRCENDTSRISFWLWDMLCKGYYVTLALVLYVSPFFKPYFNVAT